MWRLPPISVSLILCEILTKKLLASGVDNIFILINFILFEKN
jgi:hypothetical protein